MPILDKQESLFARIHELLNLAEDPHTHNHIHQILTLAEDVIIFGLTLIRFAR